jgi:hypothetical protein
MYLFTVKRLFQCSVRCDSRKHLCLPTAQKHRQETLAACVPQIGPAIIFYFSILTEACVSTLVSGLLSSGNTISTHLSSNFMSHEALKFQLLLHLESSVRLRSAQNQVARRRTSLQSTNSRRSLVTLISVTPNILNSKSGHIPTHHNSEQRSVLLKTRSPKHPSGSNR